MDVLVRRVRLSLRGLSDALILALLGASEATPDRVQTGVILFRTGDRTACWYLLLAGQVELYLTKADSTETLCVLSSGCLFGELESPCHTCCARTRRHTEFVRIPQEHLTALYNKHADHLHSTLVILHDIVSERAGVPEGTPSIPPLLPKPIIKNVRMQDDGDVHCEHSVVEFNKALSFDTKIREVGATLRQQMVESAPLLMADRLIGGQLYPQCMVGAEMVTWLLGVALSTTNGSPLSRLQVSGMWQSLLENHAICHVTNEQQFVDKQVFYRWEDSVKAIPACVDSLQEQLTNAIFFLNTIGPDALFRTILAKPPNDRTPEELEHVYEELLHVKALSHLSTMVKRELAKVVVLEWHSHEGTVVFRQGDVGTSWYIILKGSVDVLIHGKGVVCTLREGDDFGKLALVNNSPRTATITLRDHNTQFLKVEKNHFNRILRDVEANTVRLKEHGQDVLVLEKVSIPRGVAVDRKHCSYSVMAGLAEKMLEYLLETRIDAQEEDVASMDPTLDDFLLTHTVFLPSNMLCKNLKQYYARRLDVVVDVLQSKRRVVTFLALWVRSLGIHFFLDPTANSFVEEMYCCVWEDSRSLPGMEAILVRANGIRQARERAMRALHRHPAVVLNCGVYTETAPAPTPVLPVDLCNQVIRLSDSSTFTIHIGIDKKAYEICEMSSQHPKERLVLVEVKSGGERIVIDPRQVSVPTMLSLNSKLYVVCRDEIDCLETDTDFVPAPSVSVLDLYPSSEISLQLSLFHLELLVATNEMELISQVFGRDSYPGRIPVNLDLLLRRFNEIQFWTTTEVLSQPAQKRLQALRKLTKIAMYSKDNGDLLSLFAITLGLSNVAVSRLASLWERLPNKIRRGFAQLESFLDPTRNHRAYRTLAAKMHPPYVPFVPLLLKDLTFVHEGNKTFFSGLVNFEKMVLRSFKECKANYSQQAIDSKKLYHIQTSIRNFRVIDNQRKLMELSYQIEPRKKKVN